MEDLTRKRDVELLRRLRNIRRDVSVLQFKNILMYDKEQSFEKEMVRFDERVGEEEIKMEKIKLKKEEEDVILKKACEDLKGAKEGSEEYELFDLRKTLSEKKIKECDDEINEVQGNIERLKNDKEVLRQKFTEEIDCGDKENKGFVEELRVLKKEMEDVLDSLTSFGRSVYDSACFCGYNNEPVAIVVGGYCENCNNSVSSQDIIHVLQGKDYIKCETCGCILVDSVKTISEAVDKNSENKSK